MIRCSAVFLFRVLIGAFCFKVSFVFSFFYKITLSPPTKATPRRPRGSPSRRPLARPGARRRRGWRTQKEPPSSSSLYPSPCSASPPLPLSSRPSSPSLSLLRNEPPRGLALGARQPRTRPREGILAAGTWRQPPGSRPSATATKKARRKKREERGAERRGCPRRASRGARARERRGRKRPREKLADPLLLLLPRGALPAAPLAPAATCARR